MEERENNIDLLRVIASIMVIALHVGSIYGKSISPEYPTYYFTIGNFYHSITRTAVPIFVMLSGSFLLKNIKNMNYHYYYKKIFGKIVVPTLIFSFLYVLYSIAFGFLLSHQINFFEPFIAWFRGGPYYHMWYMYMIMGFYAITPILIKVRLVMGDKIFEALGWIFMIFGILFNLSPVRLIWPIQFIPYLGYFILGYSFKNRSKEKSYIPYLVVTIISLISVFLITELNIRFDFWKNKFYFLSPLSPLVVIGSICMYISFLNMKKLKIRYYNMAKHTFTIYLLHAGVLSIIDLIIRHVFIKYPNPIWYMPMLILFVFIISYGISVSINNIIEKFKIKNILKT